MASAVRDTLAQRLPGVVARETLVAAVQVA